MSLDEPSREQPEARVAILDAYLLAAGRRQEVIDIAAESESPEDARHAMAQQLDVSVERDSIRGRLDRGL